MSSGTIEILSDGEAVSHVYPLSHQELSEAITRTSDALADIESQRRQNQNDRGNEAIPNSREHLLKDHLKALLACEKNRAGLIVFEPIVSNVGGEA